MLAVPLAAQAQKKYDPGASDTEIRIGNSAPYSGPASAYGTIGRAMSAYAAKINAEGGVNGRKINLLSLDDGYNPAKAVEQTRKLVEQEEVLAMFAMMGSGNILAVQRYLNGKKVPQLFLLSGASRFDDPKNFPWTLGWMPSYRAEARIFAEYVQANMPNAKIGVLYQNDEFGKDYLNGLTDALGDKAKKMIVAQISYEVTDPTIDSQLIALKASGADVLFNISSPKFAAQSIRKVGELGWKPFHYLSAVSASVASVLKPAGLDHSTGLVTAMFMRDPSDPSQASTQEVKEYLAFMKAHYAAGDPNDPYNVFGYSLMQTLVHTLRQCGDNLTRANLMQQASSLSMTVPMLLPGIDVRTGPDDFRPVERLQLARFNGSRFELFGKVLGR
nr:ABC transporter substrate-binding protein [Ramlibacter sp. WS9]